MGEVYSFWFSLWAKEVRPLPVRVTGTGSARLRRGQSPALRVGFSSQTIFARLTIETSLPSGLSKSPQTPAASAALVLENSAGVHGCVRVPRKLSRVPRGPPSLVLVRFWVWRREWAVNWKSRSLQLRDWYVQSLPLPARHSSDQTKSKLR